MKCGQGRICFPARQGGVNCSRRTTRPHFRICSASQVVVPDQATAKALNKYIQRANEDHKCRLCFVSLDKKFATLAVFAVASFASNADLASQLGYVIVLIDADGTAISLRNTSVKFKRFSRSVLTAELFAAVHAFDYWSILRATLSDRCFWQSCFHYSLHRFEVVIWQRR